MWSSQLHHQISLDILPLRRRGATFTWKTLDELRARLIRATVYHCGAGQELEDRLAAALAEAEETCRPSFFDAEKNIRPLPQAHMLLEWTGKGGQKTCALLTDKMACVELYIFRYNEELQRWRWPLLGMAYGPTFDDNCRIAVYEPALLAKSSAAAQKAMLQEHVLDARLALVCLELVRRELVQPEGSTGPTASELQARKQPRDVLPTPSALARSSRTRHEKGVTGKGAHRM
ncbi:MAG TPA: hypothetical protein H9894_00695 [Candidatus Desulfovibrio intestinipullorum]|uniref:Uncharacterized protein n=1 Tax=Candidatus Desulfovibrio intestinipullorum TaxID=2838536 RepID=A0A9D1TNK9_9BACT|nr:hypothetical protein [Candidatus Desulfovibrio intestinipullorum]